MFITPHLQAVWRLDVCPRMRTAGFDYTYFYLRLIGFQAPDGSLSTDKAESIVADYKIYLLSSTNEQKRVSEGVFEFEIGTTKTIPHWAKRHDPLIHPDGSLSVVCEIECLVSEETFSLEPTLNPDLLDHNLEIADHFKKMWKSQLFTDCTIKVGAKSFPAHKCILGYWSKVFQNMFSLPTEEAKSGIVEIEDFTPDVINAMLEYMYTGQVKKRIMHKLALKLLPLADKYDISPLKEMCEVFLASKLTATNVLNGAIFANRHLATKLKKACANRLAIDGRAVLQSKEWKDLKSNDKDLANELLELMIKDHPSFGDVQEEAGKDAK